MPGSSVSWVQKPRRERCLSPGWASAGSPPHSWKVAWVTAACFLTHPQLFLTLGQTASLPNPRLISRPVPPRAADILPRDSPLCRPSCDRPQGGPASSRGRAEGWGWEALERPRGRRVLASNLVTGVSKAARPSKQENTRHPRPGGTPPSGVAPAGGWGVLSFPAAPQQL